MDEQDNQQRDESGLPQDQARKASMATWEVLPMLPTEGAEDERAIEKAVAVASLSNGHTHAPGRPQGSPLQPVTSAKMQAIRRSRVNRIVLLKRRHMRLSQDAASRPMKASVVVLFVLVSLLSSSAGAAFAYYQAQLPLLNGIANHTLFQTTRIYDRNNHLLYELYDHSKDHGRRTYINYDDLSQKQTTSPPLIVQATVAAEDHTFWDNNGIDLQGILRAVYLNVQSQSIVGGGSTITQQLIKNQFFTYQPRNLQVKSEEAILAYGLTQQYPKWKIMEMYLNTVYYGDLNYGVEAAAQGYFNLQPECKPTHCVPATAKLDLAQASFLAGLPQSPSYYNAFDNIDSKTHRLIAGSPTLVRHHEVLQSMVQLGMITDKQAAQAQEEMEKYQFQPYTATHTMQAPHFVRYVVDQVLVPLLGAQNLLNGGYNIYTTLDLDLERYVEKSLYDHLYQVQSDNYLGTYGPLNVNNNVNNAAAVVMNPFNGEILAMNGSAKFNDTDQTVQGQYNAAVALRQPGSSFKPIVYATAFEMGWYPAMILLDHKTIYPSSPPYYSPPNYDGKFHTGFPMTVRNAIANSFNIPAVDAIEFAGLPNVLNMAARLGLTEVADRHWSTLLPSMALGTAEVSLLHLTGAYATFANGGERVPPTSILEITDSQGHPLYTYDSAHPHGIRALRADVAFLMTSILSDKASRYHEFGPGNPLELDRPAAAKTGTTDSFRDNWTMGYTPYLTVGVWAGNSDNSTMNDIIGITGAGPIWHDIMEYASNLYHYPANDFPKPDDVHLGTVSASTGLLPHQGEATVTDWFIDGTMPTIQGLATYVAPPRCRRDNCNPGPCRGDNCRPICTGDSCISPGGQNETMPGMRP
jgi:membrane peptidoglycan carboxypeptidase